MAIVALQCSRPNSEIWKQTLFTVLQTFAILSVLMKPEILKKFTTHLRNTLTRASELAIELRNTYVNPEHFLFGLAEQKGGIAYDILAKSGLTVPMLRDFVRVRNEPVPEAPLSRDELHFSLPAKRAIEKAVLTA